MMSGPCRHEWERAAYGQFIWRCAHCLTTVSDRQLQAMPTHIRHEFWVGRVNENDRPQPTADSWVSKDNRGTLTRVYVKDMSDSHIIRWVRHFRDKFGGGPAWKLLTIEQIEAEIDSIIRERVITGAAIFAEAKARKGVFAMTMTGVTPPKAVLTPADWTIPLPLKSPRRKRKKPEPKQPDVPRGFRHIELGDD